MGESMGGAVVLLLARKKPEFWDGAVLVAPMCKVCVYHVSSIYLLVIIVYHLRTKVEFSNNVMHIM